MIQQCAIKNAVATWKEKEKIDIKSKIKFHNSIP